MPRVVRRAGGCVIAGVVACATVGCNSVVSVTQPSPDDPSVASLAGIAEITARQDGPVIPARIRRLTNDEYDATVQALLGTDRTPSEDFPPDARLHERSGFDRNAAQVVDPMWARQLQVAAQSLAAEYVAGHLAEDAPCTGSAVCARLFFEAFLPKAYRREVSTGELDTFMESVVVPSLGRDGFDGAVRLGIEAVLQTASFLYHTELGDDAPPGSLTTLKNAEIAQAMAYLLTGAPADESLLATEALGDAEVRREHARRLLETPGARVQVGKLVKQWLGIDAAGSLVKDLVRFPEFKPSLFDRESDTFIDEVVFARRGGYAMLMGADFSVGGEDLARVYDAPAPDPDTGVIDLSGLPRRGLLNRGAYLATHAGPLHPSPIKRGVRFLTQALCIEPGNPAELMLQITLPPILETETRRQRFEEHNQAPCVGCHGTIDPVGFSFEHFDAAGVWEKFEDGDPDLPIDSNVQLNLPSSVSFGDAEIADSSELALLASESEVGARCFARNAARFVAAAYGDALEEAFLERWRQDADDGRDGVQDLLVAYVAAPTFVERVRDAMEDTP